mgnify:CR=1 FL=1
MTTTAKAWHLALAIVSGSACAGALAQEFSYSGFGTVGAAVSNKDYKYQRFITDNGTVKRDSVLGVQFDAKFSSQWSATLQAKVAPAEDNEMGDQCSLGLCVLAAQQRVVDPRRQGAAASVPVL